MLRTLTIAATLILLGLGGTPAAPDRCAYAARSSGAAALRIEHDPEAGTISVYRGDGEEPVLTQHAREGVRPYIHPIIAPDGNGVLTQYRPPHHLHQTGLYWGLKQVNGRDYFMQWEDDYWRRVSASVIEERGEKVRWQTVYDLLDAQGNPVLTETQNWTMQDRDGKVLLDLEWRGEARTDVEIGEFYVGGLFLRMPWDKETRGGVVNAVGQRDLDAEAQRAIWADLGLEIEGRDDFGHIAMLDHPDNAAFPTPWRVDSQMGIGPSRQIAGPWSIDRGDTEVIRYRLVVYTGDLDVDGLNRVWTAFALE